MIKFIIIFILSFILSYNLFCNIYHLYCYLRLLYKKSKVEKSDLVWFDELIKKYDIDEVEDVDYFENSTGCYTLYLDLILKNPTNIKIKKINMTIYVTFNENIKTDKKELNKYLNERIRQKNLKQKIEKLKNNIKGNEKK